MYVVWYLNEDNEWRYVPFTDFDSAWDAFTALTEQEQVAILDYNGDPVVVNAYAQREAVT
jgi:hypothetical protein